MVRGDTSKGNGEAEGERVKGTRWGQGRIWGQSYVQEVAGSPQTAESASGLKHSAGTHGCQSHPPFPGGSCLGWPIPPPAPSVLPVAAPG